MKVSDSRKIHIMAFPQGTPLNTSLSEAQSVANASALCGSAAILPLVAMLCDIFNPPVSGRWNPMRSEEHTSELQSLMRISYAVFCLKKKKNKQKQHHHTTYTYD